MEKRDLAYKDYLAGMKYKEIAEKYEVSLSAVKSWASRYWKNEKVATNNKKKLQPKKSKVATKKEKSPPKNKGPGAPIGNKNNFKHGLYENVYWDTLDEEELELIDSMNFDEEAMLHEQIALLSIRERRLLKRIALFKENSKGGEAGLTVARVNKIKLVQSKEKLVAIDDKGKPVPDPHFNFVEDTTETNTVATIEIIQKLEGELTRVQGKKTRCIEALTRMKETAIRITLEKERMQKDTGGDGNMDALMESIDNARKQLQGSDS